MEFEIKNTDRPQMGKIYRFFAGVQVPGSIF
jgi:hypothetical protein